MFRLLLASLIWAFSYSLNKQNLADVNPFAVSAIFCAVSAITFLPVLRLTQSTLKKILPLLILGAIEFGQMYIFFQLSFNFLEAYEIALLLITTPIYVVLIDGVINGTKLAVPCLFASICILLSYLLVNVPEYSFNRYGVLLIQGSNLSFACGQVLVKNFFKKNPHLSITQTTSILYFGGFIICFLASIITNKPYAPLDGHAILWASILGTSCCGICHYLWNTGIMRVKTPVIAVMNNLQIPLSILVAVLFFGETINWMKFYTCIGMLAFIFAVFLFYRNKNT